MPKAPGFTQKEKDLLRRYLIWCYKTTKESLDRVDRYFTQLHVDRFICKELKKVRPSTPAYLDLVKNFEKYMEDKEKNVLPRKFFDTSKTMLEPNYQYLKERVFAIEKAIGYFLGKSELSKIRFLYEEEMTRRILEAREHQT